VKSDPIGRIVVIHVMAVSRLLQNDHVTASDPPTFSLQFVAEEDALRVILDSNDDLWDRAKRYECITVDVPHKLEILLHAGRLVGFNILGAHRSVRPAVLEACA
jgi:hypothetical protein